MINSKKNETVATSSQAQWILNANALCHHADISGTMKFIPFLHKCGVCNERIWNVFNLVKCLDCKIIVHKSCTAPVEYIQMSSLPLAAEDFDFATIQGVE